MNSLNTVRYLSATFTQVMVVTELQHVYISFLQVTEKGYEFLQQSGVERVPYHQVTQDCQL